ncbi:M56 family metallopeptidase [Rhodanobacter lindaniclasticus]
MNSIELATMGWTGIDWLGRGWLLLLAFTVAVLIVAALRKPCRRLFGAERAFQLWLLPPLAMLASQLPHAADAPLLVLPPVVYTITSTAAALPAHDAAASLIDWRGAMALLWLTGTVASLLLAAFAQARYRRWLRGAVPVSGVHSRWPVLRADCADLGPALVGAWRARIVLPADFEQRYDADERALILAHETAHARRGDGWWCLLARILAALCWFHPLAWWALAALRHDQELACDAAVLGEHGEQRRSYANAMLKTQSAVFALPVGCTWSPRHPLTERIAMLKQQPISILRQRSGGAILALLVVAATSAIYTGATPATVAGADPLPAPAHYTLKLDVSFDGKPAAQHFKFCVKPGEYVQVNGVSSGVPPWQGRFTVLPADKGQIEVRGDLSGGTLNKAVQPVVRTLPGRQATIQVGRQVAGTQAGDAGSETGIKLDMMTSPGC